MEPEALFEEDPKTFVAARDQLAKELRAAGQRDDAAEVRALRRPSVSAWALNQVARRDGSTIDQLLASMERARGAQDEVLAGAEREILRDAMTERRQALHAVVEAARAVIEESGRPPDATTRDIESALQGSLTPAFTDALRRGVLIDLDAGGGDDDSLSALLSASVPASTAPSTAAADAARRQQREADVARVRAEVHEAATLVANAASTLADRERELHDARQALEDARRAHERAVAALERVQSAG
jgi:hypothetical protein